MTNVFIGSEEELSHYGVKGMKWGRRKAARSAADAENDRDIKTARKQVSSYAAKTKKAGAAFDNARGTSREKKAADNLHKAMSEEFLVRDVASRRTTQEGRRRAQLINGLVGSTAVVGLTAVAGTMFAAKVFTGSWDPRGPRP